MEHDKLTPDTLPRKQRETSYGNGDVPRKGGRKLRALRASRTAWGQRRRHCPEHLPQATPAAEVGRQFGTIFGGFFTTVLNGKSAPRVYLSIFGNPTKRRNSAQKVPNKNGSLVGWRGARLGRSTQVQPAGQTTTGEPYRDLLAMRL